MNRRGLLIVLAILALVAIAFLLMRNPEKTTDAAENELDPVVQQEDKDTAEPPTAEAEEPDAESDPVEEAQMLEDGGDLVVVVPDDEELGGF